MDYLPYIVVFLGKINRCFVSIPKIKCRYHKYIHSPFKQDKVNVFVYDIIRDLKKISCDVGKFKCVFVCVYVVLMFAI